MKTKIKEIFISIQGEGPFVGVKQMFIRFCGCNLKCDYCDTDFVGDENSIEYMPEELAEKIKTYKGYEQIHSISLTGGEPLLHTEFLKEFLPKVEKPIYLETNATLAKEMSEIFYDVDIVSADIKLASSSGIINSFEMHDKFFKALKDSVITCALQRQYDCVHLDTFAKVVFDEKITDEEILECVKLARRYNFPIILQPKMNGIKLEIPKRVILDVVDKFFELYDDIRLIPQVHKFLNIE